MKRTTGRNAATAAVLAAAIITGATACGGDEENNEPNSADTVGADQAASPSDDADATG